MLWFDYILRFSWFIKFGCIEAYVSSLKSKQHWSSRNPAYKNWKKTLLCFKFLWDWFHRAIKWQYCLDCWKLHHINEIIAQPSFYAWKVSYFSNRYFMSLLQISSNFINNLCKFVHSMEWVVGLFLLNEWIYWAFENINVDVFPPTNVISFNFYVKMKSSFISTQWIEMFAILNCQINRIDIFTCG